MATRLTTVCDGCGRNCKGMERHRVLVDPFFDSDGKLLRSAIDITKLQCLTCRDRSDAFTRKGMSPTKSGAERLNQVPATDPQMELPIPEDATTVTALSEGGPANG